MDFVSTFNPPRLVKLGGIRYWVKALTLEDLALLAAWIDDVTPGHAERMTPPPLGGDDAAKLLDSPEGWCNVAFASLRHQGLSWLQAADAILNADADERGRFLTVLFARRRTFKPVKSGEDICENWWGPLISAMNEHRYIMPHQIGALSLDQLDALTGDGCKDEKPGDPDEVSFGDVVNMWADNRAKWEASQPKNGDTPDAN